MFKLDSTPPEHNNDGPEARADQGSQFASIQEFSNWIDEQLAVLESEHDDLVTVQSARSFFQR